MGSHVIDGEFQSDKYPTCPRDKVPLSVGDLSAQDLLWEYARRRRAVDAEFSDDLEAILTARGYAPGPESDELPWTREDWRALMSAGRSLDETMTSAPWRRHGLSIVGDCLHEDGPVEISDMRGEALEADGEGVPWMRNNLRSLIEICEATLVEVARLRLYCADADRTATRIGGSPSRIEGSRGVAAAGSNPDDNAAWRAACLKVDAGSNQEVVRIGGLAGLAGGVRVSHGMIVAEHQVLAPDPQAEVPRSRTRVKIVGVDPDGWIVQDVVPMSESTFNSIVEQPSPISTNRLSTWEIVMSHVVQLPDWPEELIGLVLTDMQTRDAVRCARYGTHLTPGNGRDHLVDAYQECLDAVVYLANELGEHDIGLDGEDLCEMAWTDWSKRKYLFDVWRLYSTQIKTAVQLRSLLEERLDWETDVLRPICPRCKREIDPDTCHCGTAVSDHNQGSGHSPVPMDCFCHEGDVP